MQQPGPGVVERAGHAGPDPGPAAVIVLQRRLWTSGIRSDTIGHVEAAAVCRAARLCAGLTLRALAERAGTSHSTLAAYEQGRVVPRTDTLVRICDAAGVRLDAGLMPIGSPSERAERGRQLMDVLALADAFPLQRTGPLDAPVFPSRRYDA